MSPEKRHIYYSSGGDTAISHILMISENDIKFLRGLRETARQLCELPLPSLPDTFSWVIYRGDAVELRHFQQHCDEARQAADFAMIDVNGGPAEVDASLVGGIQAAATEMWEVRFHRSDLSEVQVEWRAKHDYTSEYNVAIKLGE
jgi:hypothetical protein